MLSPDTRFTKLVAQVDGVRHSGGENHGLPALRQSVPMGHNIAYQLVGIHPVFKLASDIIALAGREGTVVVTGSIFLVREAYEATGRSPDFLHPAIDR